MGDAQGGVMTKSAPAPPFIKFFMALFSRLMARIQERRDKRLPGRYLRLLVTRTLAVT